MALPIGTTLQSDKYRLDQVLSQGNAGTTYRGTHLYLNQPIVIKALNPVAELSPAQTTSQVQRFIGTTQQLARFQHPHIVRVRDLFLQSGVPFMAMDYVPGQTLRELSLEHPLPQAQAIEYMWQVGSALRCLHQEGRLHGDVHPGNLIVSAHTHTVVLIGFSITQILSAESNQNPGEHLSQGYAAPERYLPQHRWTPATDIYGLAATLYTLVTGQVPTASPQRERRPLREPRQFQPQISFAVEQAILKGMALATQDRPQSIDDWLTLLPQVDAGPASVPSVTAPSTASLPTFSQPEASAGTRPHRTAPEVTRPSPDPSASPVPTSSSSPASPVAPRFPKRLLLWGAVLAGIAGFGLGLILRFQYRHQFAPAQIPAGGNLPLKEEKFLPKPPPTVVNSEAAESAPTPSPSNQSPSDLEVPSDSEFFAPEEVPPPQDPPAATFDTGEGPVIDDVDTDPQTVEADPPSLDAAEPTEARPTSPTPFPRLRPQDEPINVDIAPESSPNPSDGFNEDETQRSDVMDRAAPLPV